MLEALKMLHRANNDAFVFFTWLTIYNTQRMLDGAAFHR